MAVEIKDKAYKAKPVIKQLKPQSIEAISINLSKSLNWYDLSVFIKILFIEKRYAGHVETGKAGKSDPLIDGV